MLWVRDATGHLTFVNSAYARAVDASREEALARLRWGDAACGAGQQPKAEPFLEATNGVAKRGLRNAQLRCGLREAALLPDGQEGQEVIQISAVHLWHPLISPCEL